MVSAREASEIVEAEAGVCRQQSRRALLAGVAGAGVRTGGALRYDSGRSHGVAPWPEVDHEALLAASPAGVFVLRLPREAVDSPQDSWAARAAALRDQADVGDLARVQVRAQLDDNGVLPFVATVAGYPVLVGQLVDFLSVAPGRVRLELAPPDPSAAWLGPLQGRRLVTSPGPAWVLLGSQPYHQVGWGRDDMWARAV